MAANERQHFVPQFYLKNFAVDEKKTGIALYNHKTGRFVMRATIKGQAYERFLYGRDDAMEKDLAKFESEVAKLFADPITKILPPLNPDDFKLFKEYILVQLYRTKKAGDELLDSLNAGFQAILPLLKEGDRPKSPGRISHDLPALVSLLHALKHLPLMNYLAIKSFVNLTPIPFITSDSPVITYNQWMEKKRHYTGATAIAVMGLQIFFPIAPRLMYCLCDPNIYEYDFLESPIVAIESEAEIHQLNILQYLFSDSHLYFDNNIPKEYIESLVDENKDRRVSTKPVSKVVAGDELGTGNSNPILIHSFNDPQIQLDLSFFKLTERSMQIEVKNGFPLLRHPSFHQLRNKLS